MVLSNKIKIIICLIILIPLIWLILTFLFPKRETTKKVEANIYANLKCDVEEIEDSSFLYSNNPKSNYAFAKPKLMNILKNCSSYNQTENGNCAVFSSIPNEFSGLKNEFKTIYDCQNTCEKTESCNYFQYFSNKAGNYSPFYLCSLYKNRPKIENAVIQSTSNFKLLKLKC